MTDTIESATSVDAARSVATTRRASLDDVDDVLVGTVTRTFAPVFDGPPPEQGLWGYADAAVQLVGGALSLPGDLVEAGLAGVTSAVVPPGMGFPAANIGLGMHLGIPHLHPQTALLGTPLPGFGPTALVGALNVMIAGVPALRCGDVGFALGCMGTPTFEVFTGSSNVFIGGKRAARGLDFTRHCDPFAALLTPGAAIGVGLDLMSCGAAVTNFAAHTAAALTHAEEAEAAGSDSQAAELARAESAAEMRQAIVNSVQILLDASLSAMTSAIGTIPPLGLMGDGVVIGVTVSSVLIGGLPIPGVADIVNAWAHHWARRLACHVGSRIRTHIEANLGCRSALEPVGLLDGNVFADSVDADLAGFRFTRHYDTRDRSVCRDLGRGNRHGLDRELRVWLHRVEYVDAQGGIFRLPAFRGQDEVCDSGCVVRRLGADRYEVQHAGETMHFVAARGRRDATLTAIQTEAGIFHLTLDRGGRIEGLAGAEGSFSFAHDASGRIVSVHDARGGTVLRYAYDRAACLLSLTNALGQEERFAYDLAGRLTRWRDQRGYEFEWDYDARGRCVYSSGGDGQWRGELAYGDRQTRLTIAPGQTFVYHFDARGIVTRVIRPDGGVLVRDATADGRVTREIDAGGREVRWVYDATGAHIGRVDRFGRHLGPAGDGPCGESSLARTLPHALEAQLGLAAPIAPHARNLAVPAAAQPIADWALRPNRVAAASRAERDPVGRLSREVDSRGRATVYRRDAAGNATEVTDRDGHVTRLEIVGWNLVGAEVDALGRRRAFTYTSDERVSSYRDANGNVTEYLRDVVGRVAQVFRGGAKRDEYVLDAGDRLREKRDGDGNTLLRIVPHANALPGEIALSSGGRLVFDYDARGRHTRASSDTHDARIERDADGRITFDLRDGRGVRRWNLASVEITSLFERFETHVTLDTERSTVRDCTGASHSFERAEHGRAARTLSNGTREIHAFDEDGRLSGHLSYRTAPRGALCAWAARYERSAEGDLLSAWDTTRGARRFEIDAAHRLSAEIGPFGRCEYLLDAADNVVEMPGFGRADVGPGNVLRETERERFMHDARGRLAVRRGAEHEVRYEYDSLDQLVRVDDGSPEPWTATYDGLGRRCRFGRASASTELFWDGDRIAAEVYASGALRVHVYARADALIPFMFVDYASVDSEPESGRCFFVFHDASGMPIQIEDANGRTVWWVDHVDPFGELTIREGAEVEYRLRWPGHYADPDLALHYNRYRDYDPRIARYLQPDPVGHAGSPGSLYAYVPNPLVDVDLLGLHDASHTRAPAHAEGDGAHPLMEHPPDPPGTRRNVVGRLIDGLSRFVEDPRSEGRSRRPDIRRTREQLTGRASLDPSDPAVRAMLDARRQARVDRVLSLLVLDFDGAEQAGHRNRVATEALGDMAADAHVREHYPNAELLHRDSGSDTFDRVYRIPGDPPQTLVVEAKGGSAGESSSRMFGRERVQQGTPEYRESVAAEMQRRGAARGDVSLEEAGAAVRASGDDTLYIVVQQPVGADGALAPMRAYAYGDSHRRDGSVSHALTPGGRPTPRTSSDPAPTSSPSPPGA